MFEIKIFSQRRKPSFLGHQWFSHDNVDFIKDPIILMLLVTKFSLEISNDKFLSSCNKIITIPQYLFLWLWSIAELECYRSETWKLQFQRRLGKLQVSWKGCEHAYLAMCLARNNCEIKVTHVSFSWSWDLSKALS